MTDTAAFLIVPKFLSWWFNLFSFISCNYLFASVFKHLTSYVTVFNVFSFMWSRVWRSFFHWQNWSRWHSWDLKNYTHRVLHFWGWYQHTIFGRFWKNPKTIGWHFFTHNIHGPKSFFCNCDTEYAVKDLYWCLSYRTPNVTFLLLLFFAFQLILLLLFVFTVAACVPVYLFLYTCVWVCVRIFQLL